VGPGSPWDGWDGSVSPPHQSIGLPDGNVKGPRVNQRTRPRKPTDFAAHHRSAPAPASAHVTGPACFEETTQPHRSLHRYMEGSKHG
jgi:hypothetical protein